MIGCGFSHFNNDDPIAFPGQPGKSHNHTFIGNRAVDAATTPTSLLGGESSCGDVGDASAYWVPTLFTGRQPLRPLVGVGYYVRRTTRAGAGVPIRAEDDRGQRALPAGRSRCRSSAGLRRLRRRAALGDGADLSAGPVAEPARDLPQLLERARPRQRRPSAPHGVRIGRAVSALAPGRLPSLMLIFLYPPTERARPIQASGRYGTHADFINGWDQETSGEGGGGPQLRRYNARPRGYSSAGRAPGSHPGGRRFEPA